MAGKLLMGTLGAAGMYFLDNRLGRRRRAILRDKLLRLAHEAGHGIELGARDLAHRLQGLAAEGRHLVSNGDAPDATVEARVRSLLGRIVRRPKLIKVVSSGGIVALGGPIAAHEHDQLIGAVRMTRGVHGIDNALQIKHAGDDKGGDFSRIATTHGHTFELMQENWSPAARLLVTAAGAWMTACGLRRGGAIGSFKAVVGASLLLRRATNLDISRLTGIGAPAGGRRGIDVHKTINIRAGISEVFGFFSNYDNFPLFMHNVREVRDRGDGLSHWVVAGPAGVHATWDAILTDYQPNRCIAWASTNNSIIGHTGVIRFDENPDGSTRVSVRMSYNPPGGLVGHTVASLLRSDPKSEMDDDLARLKTLIERGKFPHDAARRASVLSPASPPLAVAAPPAEAVNPT